MPDRTLDDINRELSEVLDELLAVPSDSFAERYEIQKRQIELRKEAAAFAQDHDAERSTEDLQKELAAMRANLKALVGDRISLTQQAGGGDKSNHGVRGSIGINTAMDQAQGTNRVRARVGRLEGILLDRGESID